jgi:hypothetical protein
MADGIDPRMDAMKVPRPESSVDRLPLHAPVEQLHPCHDAVLALTGGRQDRVESMRLQ